MPRKQIPKAVADVTGRTKHNPKRHKDRKASIGAELGEAPVWMDENQEAAWEHIKMAVGWLCESDRLFVESMAVMYAQLMDPSLLKNASWFSTWKGMCSTAGCTPTDISKISAAQHARARAAAGDDDTKGSPHEKEEVKPAGKDRFFN
jgi:hypothetical protein